MKEENTTSEQEDENTPSSPNEVTDKTLPKGDDFTLLQKNIEIDCFFLKLPMNSFQPNLHQKCSNCTIHKILACLGYILDF